MEALYVIFCVWFVSTVVGSVVLIKAVSEAMRAVRVMEDVTDETVANFCKYLIEKIKSGGTPLTYTAWKNKFN